MYTPFCHRRFSDFFEDIWAAYTDQDTQEQGVSTGWKGLDPFYRVRTALLKATFGKDAYVQNAGPSGALCVAGGPRGAQHCHWRAKLWQV